MLIRIDSLSEGPGSCYFHNKKCGFGLINVAVPVVASHPSRAVDGRAEGEGICSGKNRESKNSKANSSGRMYSLLFTPPVHLLFCPVY